jgi:hypothetical protein
MYTFSPWDVAGLNEMCFKCRTRTGLQRLCFLNHQECLYWLYVEMIILSYTGWIKYTCIGPFFLLKWNTWDKLLIKKKKNLFSSQFWRPRAGASAQFWWSLSWPCHTITDHIMEGTCAKGRDRNARRKPERGEEPGLLTLWPPFLKN